MMSQALTLVRLTDEQVKKAKEANGAKLRITHALICGQYGQLFGTEKQCRKYFVVWRKIFRSLFSHVQETTSFEIDDYKSTFNLVMTLIAANDAPHRSPRDVEGTRSAAPKAKKGFWRRLFRL